MFAFIVYSCLCGSGSDLALASTRLSQNPPVWSRRLELPVSSCHCNRLWAHRSRNSPYHPEIYTTGSNHLDDLTFRFSAHFVQSFRRYSPIIVPTTQFEHCQLSPSNHILLLLFLSHRHRFRCSTTPPRFVVIQCLLHSHFDHITVWLAGRTKLITPLWGTLEWLWLNTYGSKS